MNKLKKQSSNTSKELSNKNNTNKIKGFLLSVKVLILRIFKKIKSQTTPVSIILSQLYLIFLSCCIVYMTFRIQRDHEPETLKWLSENIDLTLLSFMLFFVLCEVLYLLALSVYVPLIALYPICIAASIVNVLKIQLRSEPLVFTDLLLIRESANIVSEFTVSVSKYLFQPITVFIILAILPLVFFKHIKLNLIKRGICILCAIGITATAYFALVVPEETFIEEKMALSVWNLTDEYTKNGFLLSFFKSFKRSIVFAPKNYNEKTVRAYADEMGYNKNTEVLSISDDELPNVIVIMSESYWDSNNLTGTTFNQDPMQAVRGYLNTNGNRSILSPELGGGTSNVEYEFLTGKSVSFYPPNSMVYQQYISKEQWSLAWYFRDLGYVTTSIHPYYDWFWRRNKVYPLLGFENMFFAHDMAYIDYKGAYISDKSLTTEIISKYNKFSDGGEKPIFTFAISMQNHGGYYDSKYTDRQIELMTKSGSQEIDIATEVFFEGVYDASNAFVELTEYFKDVERPTYIVMFGDHAPPGIAEYKHLYALDEELNLFPQDNLNMYKTPLIIWTNTGEEIKKQGTISTFFLTEEIFDMTGLPKPGYIQMLSNVRNYTQGFTNRYILDSNGIAITDEEELVKIRDIINKLEICQYDATFGKHYVIKELD